VKLQIDDPSPYADAQFQPADAPFLTYSAAEQSADEGVLKSLLTDWDVAVRYHDLKAKLQSPRLHRRIAEISVREILLRAQGILGALVHSRTSGVAPLQEVPSGAEGVELDLDATLENSLPERLEPWMSFKRARVEPVILCVDTSLSMTGEKLALTAVAVAVVLLEFPDDPVGVVTFETEPHVVKGPNEQITIPEMVKRFLEAPSKGYTDIEDGLLAALKQVSEISSLGFQRPASVVLISDGKYTAGKDPSYLADRFPHLQVVKIGTDRSSQLLCHELARKGRGGLREVADMKDLPQALFNLVKELIRGRYY
jgi:Mg-chelatase subunit ChlD